MKKSLKIGLVGLLLVGTLTFSNIFLNKKENLKEFITKIGYSQNSKKTDKEKTLDDYINFVYKNIKTSKIINKNFIKSIIITESSGDIYAIGTSGEKGLMQIREGTWKDREKNIEFHKGAFNPYNNIKVGIKQLNWINNYCETRHPEWNKLPQEQKHSLISAAYNRGQFKLWNKNWNINEMSKITRNYVKKRKANY